MNHIASVFKKFEYLKEKPKKFENEKKDETGVNLAEE